MSVTCVTPDFLNLVMFIMLWLQISNKSTVEPWMLGGIGATGIVVGLATFVSMGQSCMAI